MIYGYSRISDSSQNIESQVDVLNRYGCDEILEETVSGVKEDKELNNLIAKMTAGDTLVVARVDRLGRSTRQILMLAEELKEKDAELVILDLGIDTRTPGGKMVLTIMASVAEYERSILKQKQQQGIATARKMGKNLGRKAQWSKQGMQEAIVLYENNEKTISDIERIYRIPRSSFYRELKKYRLSQEKKKKNDDNLVLY